MSPVGAGLRGEGQVKNPGAFRHERWSTVRRFALLGLVSFLPRCIAAQAVTDAPGFETAAVYASAPATNPDTFVSGGLLPEGRYDLRRATLLDLIGIAWGVDPAKVLGGPGWIGFDRFDISAKAPSSTRPETFNLMLQSLLADRFKLVLHKDTRPLPAFVLVRGDGKPKLRQSDGSGDSGCQAQPQSTGNSSVAYSCRNMTMGALAATLGRIAGDYLREPVVDASKVEGMWDFDLKWNPRSRVPEAGGDRITIFEAVDRQLGLKLELQQLPSPVLVVDRANEKPAANPVGVEKALPPRSLEFEVATVKLSRPDERFGLRRYPGGRLELRAFPMKMLIATAWDVDWDHMDERIAGAPKWIDLKRFDIVANSSTPSVIPQGTGGIDQDFQLMLQSLLIDRFKIAAHFESRPVPAYILTAVKPRLTKADPSNRSNCREAGVVARDPRDVNPRLSRLIQCQNMTMAQFAQQLKSMDRVEAAFNDVADETGLRDAYDFAISFTPRRMLQMSSGRDLTQAVDSATSASDPNGAISFVDALRQQLGLKLEMRKRPMPVLVIDHIENTPAEN